MFTYFRNYFTGTLSSTCKVIMKYPITPETFSYTTM